MIVWGPVDDPTRGPQKTRDLAGEVLVLSPASMPREDLEEDLIGLGAPHRPLMGEEHEVHPALGVQLEEDPDVLPKLEGLLIVPSLDEGPRGAREGMEAPGEEPLEDLEARVLHLLEDPEGHVREVPGHLVELPPVRGPPGRASSAHIGSLAAELCHCRRMPPEGLVGRREGREGLESAR